SDGALCLDKNVLNWKLAPPGKPQPFIGCHRGSPGDAYFPVEMFITQFTSFLSSLGLFYSSTGVYGNQKKTSQSDRSRNIYYIAFNSESSPLVLKPSSQVRPRLDGPCTQLPMRPVSN